jgi:hypothetical protein
MLVYQRVSFSHVEICGNYIKASCPRDVFWTLYGALRSPKSNSMGYTFLLHQFSRILETRSGFESFLGPLNWHELTMSALNWVSTLYQGSRETFPVPSSCPMSLQSSSRTVEKAFGIWYEAQSSIQELDKGIPHNKAIFLPSITKIYTLGIASGIVSIIRPSMPNYDLS